MRYEQSRVRTGVSSGPPLSLVLIFIALLSRSRDRRCRRPGHP
jgi:hypothetical protein